MIYETQEQLDEALAYWQKVLRLQDWRIAALVRRQAYIKEGCSAHISMHHSGRIAEISILDPVDYPEDLIEPQDQEISLVHELVHIHSHSLRYAETESEHEAGNELIVSQVADALIRLKSGT